MNVYAVDPGPEQSALVIFDGSSVIGHVTLSNSELLMTLSGYVRVGNVLVIEQIAAMGMAVGAEVFETVFWSGRFAQAWQGDGSEVGRLFPWARIKRHVVKMHLCGNMRAKDANIRQALIDRFGPGKEVAIGKSKHRGPLFGVSGDQWSALAIAVTWWDAQSSAMVGRVRSGEEDFI